MNINELPADIPVERSTRARLTTAQLLLAQFNEQLTEWKHMPPAKRRRSARGKDLRARLDGLKTGQATYTARVADLEARLKHEQDTEQ